MEKRSAATFIASLGNTVRGVDKGAPLARIARQNLGIATGTSAGVSPVVAAAAQAAGGSLEAHAVAQAVNFGSSALEAGAGTLLGRFAADTPLVQRLLAKYGPKAGVANSSRVRDVASSLGLSKSSEVTTELRPHQLRVLRRINEQPGLVVAHGLGSGKTLTSIAAGEDLGGDTVVVAPAALLGNYKKEVDKHVGSPDTRRFLESLQRLGLREELNPSSGKLLVVDEAHRLRDPSSKTRKALAGVAPSFDKKLLLTATPVYNHPHDLAALVNLVSGESLLPMSKGDFSKEYVSSEKVKPGFFARLRGVKPGTRQRLTNQKKLGEILGSWVDYHDNPPEGFPSVSYEKVDVPMSDSQHRLYSSFMGEAPAWLRHKVRKGLPPSKAESKQLNAFASATRQVSNTTLPFDTVTPEAEQLAASAKLKHAVEELSRRHADDPEYRSVVYSNFLDAGLSPYEKLLQDTKVPYGKFTGGMKRTERDELVRRYNEGDLRALLISSAGGEGLDLKGTRLIQVLDPHWNEEKIRQVIGRGVRYKSHAHLPEEDRNVVVQRYRSTLPERKGLGRLFRGKDRGGSIDTYLSMLSEEKDFLNEQVRALMRQETARRS